MEKTKLFYDVSEFFKVHIKPKISIIIGREPLPLSKDVLVPQIMITYGILEDHRILITFHVATEDGKEEELLAIIDRLTNYIEEESKTSRFYIYDYGRTRVLHPVIDGKPFLQKLCHFAARLR